MWEEMGDVGGDVGTGAVMRLLVCGAGGGAEERTGVCRRAGSMYVVCSVDRDSGKHRERARR